MQQDVNKSAEELTVQKGGGLSERLTSGNGLIGVLIIAVCAVVFVVHWPALSAQALSFDDNQYFVENFLVRSPGWQSAKRFLTEVLEPSTVKGYYQPLTMISLMVDYALGGQSESLRPFHITSLALHIANTALIIVLLYQLFGLAWVAAGVGLLFGVHPLTVEPIPWIGERKTLLAAFFALWSLVLYVHFVQKDNRKAYLGCIVMYVLALISKPTSTPLPVVMLLMDFWPLRRLKWRSIVEKLPLLVVGGISAVITYISQSRTALMVTPQVYGPTRVPFLICHDIIFYLYKIVWPSNLSPHYPFPDPLGFSAPMVMAGVIGTCVLIPLLVVSLRWTRALLTGWLIFFVAVFPTMQTFQFGNVIASDKFVYLPSIGLLMILTAFLSRIRVADGTRQHRAKCIVTAIIVLMLVGAESFATRRYLAYWKDTITLFTRIVRLAPNAMTPLHNLGVAYTDKGDMEEAVKYFQDALKIQPNDIDAIMNLGKIYIDDGRYAEAMSYYEKALSLSPKDARVYGGIGVILTHQGRYDEAIAAYRKGLELKPDSISFNNLGVILYSKGRPDEAEECYKRAIELNLRNAEAYYNLGNVLLAKGEFEQAINRYKKALRINPGYTKARSNLAIALMRQGRLDEAIDSFTEASKIEPNNVDVHYNLACALLDKGWLQGAADEYRQVLKLQPQDVNTRCILGDVLARQGRFDEAAVEYRQALKIDPQNIQAQEGLSNIDSGQRPGQTTK
jgi:tetratricopeptide (TPR) repeat protein